MPESRPRPEHRSPEQLREPRARHRPEDHRREARRVDPAPEARHAEGEAMKPPYEMTWSLGPGPAAVDARVKAERAAERFDHARAANALWEAEQRPLQPHLRAMLARTFAEAAQQRERNTTR